MVQVLYPKNVKLALAAGLKDDNWAGCPTSHPNLPGFGLRFGGIFTSRPGPSQPKSNELWGPSRTNPNCNNGKHKRRGQHPVVPPPEPCLQLQGATNRSRTSTRSSPLNSNNPETEILAVQTPAPESKSQDNSVNQSKKQKLTSGIWEHFTKIGVVGKLVQPPKWGSLIQF
ncbi:hypothetical protein PCANC_28898 [Puccinia coronata f. sp. avenae]|uniref:Uncharacterized protein n=1 Tax=Puccinia coronata f. sp. avenae TaxID=200324 RepID=A0A2N5RUH7_9BASI|nr:hypothetical protein PCANC_28898 [Puccinia coronata f. sp. avenae]